MDEMTITKNQLRATLLAWQRNFKAGKTRSHEETDALPDEQVADESCAYVWELLEAHKEPTCA